MTEFRVEIEVEESPVSNTGSAIFVTLVADGKKMEDILDIHEFYRSLSNEGVFEYFTCTCGIFGCGGFYSKVKHTESAYVLENLYAPENDFVEDEMLESFTYEVSWSNILEVAEEVYKSIEAYFSNNVGGELTVGVAGGYLKPYLSEFRNQTDTVKAQKTPNTLT
ncbi:hypothetical protein [Fusibacter sp. JL216-2]|uniref:hypothetical protein n=1 Tax=Fusibacter sp. JL216-2 TaxID=3071453 RepID=UPI003D340327